MSSSSSSSSSPPVPQKKSVADLALEELMVSGKPPDFYQSILLDIQPEGRDAVVYGFAAVMSFTAGDSEDVEIAARKARVILLGVYQSMAKSNGVTSEQFLEASKSDGLDALIHTVHEKNPHVYSAYYTSFCRRRMVIGPTAALHTEKPSSAYPGGMDARRPIEEKYYGKTRTDQCGYCWKVKTAHLKTCLADFGN